MNFAAREIYPQVKLLRCDGMQKRCKTYTLGFIHFQNNFHSYRHKPKISHLLIIFMIFIIKSCLFWIRFIITKGSDLNSEFSHLKTPLKLSYLFDEQMMVLA